MKCSNCGKELSSTAKFCNGCGTPVEVNNYEENDAQSAWGTYESGNEDQGKAAHRNEETKKTGGDKKTIIFFAGIFVLALVAGLIVKGMGGKDKADNDQPIYENVGEEDGQDYSDADLENQEEDDTMNQTDTTEASTFVETPDMEGYMLPGSDSRVLTLADLEGLTAEECRIARNEIYARHGRMFADETLQAYFLAKDWYRPTIKPEDFNESMLNEYEVANRDLIVEFEEAKGYR